MRRDDRDARLAGRRVTHRLSQRVSTGVAFGAEATHVGVKPVNSLTAGLGAGMFVPHSGCNWRADCLGLHGTARAATLPQRAFDRAQDYDAFGSGRVTCRQPGARSTPSE